MDKFTGLSDNLMSSMCTAKGTGNQLQDINKSIRELKDAQWVRATNETVDKMCSYLNNGAKSCENNGYGDDALPLPKDYVKDIARIKVHGYIEEFSPADLIDYLTEYPDVKKTPAEIKRERTTNKEEKDKCDCHCHDAAKFEDEHEDNEGETNDLNAIATGLAGGIAIANSKTDNNTMSGGFGPLAIKAGLAAAQGAAGAASSAVSKASEMAVNVKDQAETAVEGAKDQAETAVEGAKDQAKQTIEGATEQSEQTVEGATEQSEQIVADAKTKEVPSFEEMSKGFASVVEASKDNDEEEDIQLTEDDLQSTDAEKIIKFWTTKVADMIDCKKPVHKRVERLCASIFRLGFQELTMSPIEHIENMEDFFEKHSNLGRERLNKERIDTYKTHLSLFNDLLDREEGIMGYVKVLSELYPYLLKAELFEDGPDAKKEVENYMKPIKDNKKLTIEEKEERENAIAKAVGLFPSNTLKNKIDRFKKIINAKEIGEPVKEEEDKPGMLTASFEGIMGGKKKKRKHRKTKKIMSRRPIMNRTR